MDPNDTFCPNPTLLSPSKSVKMKSHLTKPLRIIALGDAAYKVINLLYDLGVYADYYAICKSITYHPDIKSVTLDPPQKEYIPGVKKFMVPNMEVDVKIPYEIDKLLTETESDNNCHYLVIAGLGGYTGTKCSIAIIEKLILTGKQFSFIVSYPFSFEGRNRSNNADLFVNKFSANPNVRILRLNDLRKAGDIMLNQAFTYADWAMAEIANQELELGLEMKPFILSKPSKESMEREKRLMQMSDDM